MLTIGDNDIVGICGDSRSALTTGGDATNLCRWWDPLRAISEAHFAAKRVANNGRPVVPWVDFAVDGTTVQTQATTIAANIALYKVTKLITYLIINDIRASRTTAQIKTDTDSFITNAFTAGVQEMLFIPCDADGELWSVGDSGNPNAFDAAIKDVLLPANLPATITANPNGAHVTYFDARAKVWLPNWAIYNAPAPGVAGGILFHDNPGLHPNPRGVTLLYTAVLPYITFA